VKLLEHKAELVVAQVGEGVVIQGFHRHAIEPITAATGSIQAAQDVHGGALAGAGGPHHRQVIAAVHHQVEAIEGPHLGIPAAIHLLHPHQLSHRHGLAGLAGFHQPSAA
jgi:hypothetical protein